jgi:hypothetical protein
MYLSKNQHAEDLIPKFGFAIETRIPIYKGLGGALRYSRTRTDLREESILHFNSTRASEQYRGFSINYCFESKLDILDLRIHFVHQRNKYPNDFRTDQNLMGFGFRYAHYLSHGFFASIHTDYYINVSKKIAAPSEIMPYINNVHALHVGAGLLFRLWNNK